MDVKALLLLLLITNQDNKCAFTVQQDMHCTFTV